MTARAFFDLERFGADVKRALAGRSYRAVQAKVPHITIKTLSRAVNAQPLSPANLMAVCIAFAINPMDYFSVKNQTVTPLVSRETKPGIGAILDGLREGQSQ